jgi:hypothetical protein
MSDSFEQGGGEQPRGWYQKRRDKIANEIARNRRGEYTVPTWVLAATLGVFVAAWVALIIFS